MFSILKYKFQSATLPSHFRFTDIQEKAIMSMDIILSILILKMQGMEPNEMAGKFDFFKDDLPHPGSLIAEFLQWQVR